MCPVLEQFLAIDERSLDQAGVVGAEPREQGEAVGAGHHVDRVDLEDTGGGEHLPEVAEVDSPRGPGAVQALGRYRHSPCPDEGDGPHSPVNSGERFSMNAATASPKSFVLNMGSSC